MNCKILAEADIPIRTIGMNNLLSIFVFSFEIFKRIKNNNGGTR